MGKTALSIGADTFQFFTRNPRGGKAKAVKAGKVFSVDFTMCDIDHYFLPGHSLMIQIQGSWFPLIAMNPQTFVRNPFWAVKDDYRPINISVSSDSYLECGKAYIYNE